MAQLVFDEKTMYDGNMWKFEKRLHSPLNRYIEKGAVLVRYFSQDANSSTVDRGIQDIEHLFGTDAALRYNLISDFPLYGFGGTNSEDDSNENYEDFNVEGDAIILPSTIIPKPYDFFVIQSLRQIGIFRVASISADSMRVEGFYKIHYKLQSTSREVLQKLESQVINRYNTDLMAMGTNVNPIVSEKDSVYKTKVERMVAEMIDAYKATFYNSRHNCFLYFDPVRRMNVFDLCGNEFMAKHSLMNTPNSTSVVCLHDKLYDTGMNRKYMNSVYHWIEIDAPIHMLQKFDYSLISSNGYPFSSFTQWREETLVINPLNPGDVNSSIQTESFFPKEIYNSLASNLVPTNPYEKLLWKYVHHDIINLTDAELNTAEALLTGSTHRDMWLYTPIIIFILRKILSLP